MTSKLIYYVYAYIRSKDSETAKAGTPYYIGKGCKNRFSAKHSIPVPSDVSKIVFIEKNMSEVGALALERRLIKWWGRKDTNTGILLNTTDGGDGCSGRIMSQSNRDKISERMRGNTIGKNMSLDKRNEAKERLQQNNPMDNPDYREKVRQSKLGDKNPNHNKIFGIGLTGHTEASKQKLKDIAKNRPIFECLSCNVKIQGKMNFDRHMTSNKHYSNQSFQVSG